MKRLKVLLTAVLILSIVSLCIAQAFAAENYAVSPEDKISPELAQKMAEAKEDEMLSVSVWLNDISHTAVYEKTKETLEISVEKGEVSQSAIDLVFLMI